MQIYAFYIIVDTKMAYESYNEIPYEDSLLFL